MQMTPSVSCTQGFAKTELEGDFETATMDASPFYFIGRRLTAIQPGGANFRDRQQKQAVSSIMGATAQRDHIRSFWTRPIDCAHPPKRELIPTFFWSAPTICDISVSCQHPAWLLDAPPGSAGNEL
jgi:hypothetical protein